MANTTEFLDVLDNLIASTDLSSHQKTDSQLENQRRIHKYFNSIQINPSTNNKQKLDFLEKRLRYIVKNSSRIQVNQNQLQGFFDLSSDVDIVDLLSSYYSCFYLSSISVKRTALLNELLCSAYFDIIKEIIKQKLPCYENLAQYLVFLSENKKSSKIKTIVDDVAQKYKLKFQDIIFYFKNRIENPRSFESWPEQLLYKYLQLKQHPVNASFQDFLKENNLHDLFNDNDIQQYNLLFDSYITNLFNGQIGKFKQNHATSTDSKALFEKDLFDECHIMIVWLDAHIGQQNNCQDLKDRFRQLTNSFRVASTVEECRSFLSQIKDRKVYFIIQGSLSEDIVPNIEQIIPEEMEPIVYLFCFDVSKYVEFGLDHDCIGVRGQIFDHQDDLLVRLTNDLNKYACNKITDRARQKLFSEFTKTFVKAVSYGFQIFNSPTIEAQS